MHAAFLLSALAASALGAPLEARDLVVDTVWTTVTVTITPGVPLPTPPAPVVNAGPQGNKPPAPQGYNVGAPRRNRWHPGGWRTTTLPAPPAQTTPPPSPPTPPTPPTLPPSSTPTSMRVSTSSTSTSTSTSTSSISTPSSTGSPTGGGSSDGSPVENGVSYLSVINKWRAAYGLPNMKWSSLLAGDALRTGQLDNGQVAGHHNDRADEAEVIAGGFQGVYPNAATMQGLTSFEIAMVSWLCEVPGDAQLHDGKDYCDIVSKTVNMQYSYTNGVRDRGHYDILLSKNYDNIGCAFYKDASRQSTSTATWGIWTCDLLGPGAPDHQ